MEDFLCDRPGCGHPESEHNIPGTERYDKFFVSGACWHQENFDSIFDECFQFLPKRRKTTKKVKK